VVRDAHPYTERRNRSCASAETLPLGRFSLRRTFV